jgi:hypothetical protein
VPFEGAVGPDRGLGLLIEMVQRDGST